MAYALGRRVEYYDMPTIREIVRERRRTTTGCRQSISGVAESAAFGRESRSEVALRDEPGDS